MSKFKVGDKVCVLENDHYVPARRIYTIAKIMDSDYFKYVVDEDGGKSGYVIPGEYLQCQHQWEETGDPAKLYCSQCGEYKKIPVPDKEPDPEIKAGQLWEWGRLGNNFEIRYVGTGTARVLYMSGFCKGRTATYPIHEIIGEANLVEDVEEAENPIIYKDPEIKVGQLWEYVTQGDNKHMIDDVFFKITKITDDGVVGYRYINDDVSGDINKKHVLKHANLVKDVEDAGKGSFNLDIETDNDDLFITDGSSYGRSNLTVGGYSGEKYQSWPEIIDCSEEHFSNVENIIGKYRDNSDSFTFNTKEVEMEKPETKLEKQACEEAREETVEELVAAKKKVYKLHMENFIGIEKEARKSRKKADELREKLGITDDEMKQIFEE